MSQVNQQIANINANISKINTNIIEIVDDLETKQEKSELSLVNNSNFESNVDKILMNKKLVDNFTPFRVIPIINTDGTLGFYTVDDEGYKGYYNGELIRNNNKIQTNGGKDLHLPIVLDKDITFEFTGESSIGTKVNYNLILNIPSLDTSNIPKSGKHVKVFFKYKGYGQGAGSPVVEGNDPVWFWLPSEYNSADKFNVMINKAGFGNNCENSIKNGYQPEGFHSNNGVATVDYFIPHDLSYLKKDTLKNPNPWIGVSKNNNGLNLIGSNSPFGVNDFEEDGTFDSLIMEYIQYVLKKNVVRKVFHGCSNGSMQYINPRNNWNYWKPIRFKYDFIIFNSWNLTSFSVADQVEGFNKNYYQYPDPDARNWIPDFPKTNILIINGMKDPFLLSYGVDAYPAWFKETFGLNIQDYNRTYTAPVTAEFFAKKFGLDLTPKPITSRSGFGSVYPGETSIKYSGYNRYMPKYNVNKPGFGFVAWPPAEGTTNKENDNINVYAIMLKEGGHVDFNKSITGQDGDFCDVLIDFFNGTLN